MCSLVLWPDQVYHHHCWNSSFWQSSLLGVVFHHHHFVCVRHTESRCSSQHFPRSLQFRCISLPEEFIIITASAQLIFHLLRTTLLFIWVQFCKLSKAFWIFLLLVANFCSCHLNSWSLQLILAPDIFKLDFKILSNLCQHLTKKNWYLLFSFCCSVLLPALSKALV